MIRNALIVLIFLFVACSKQTEPPVTENLQLRSISVGSTTLSLSEDNVDAPTGMPVVCRFNQPLDTSTVAPAITLSKVVDNAYQPIAFTVSFLDAYKSVSCLPDHALEENTLYRIEILNTLRGQQGESFQGISYTFRTLSTPFTLIQCFIDDSLINPGTRVTNVGFTPRFKLGFSYTVDATTLNNHVHLKRGSLLYNLTPEQVNDTTVAFACTEPLPYLHRYEFTIDPLTDSVFGKPFDGYSLPFYTKTDSTPKFPLLADSALLTLIEQQTFTYFWDFAHPVSGLSRERNTSYETVTSGGSGFGMMTIPVAINRGFITRSEGIARLQKIVDFLGSADRFHGAWPHWMDGSTGKVIPFSGDDDGADLVETSYLVMGLLTARQYLNPQDATEASIIADIDTLWEGVDWNWFTQGENSLTWHWSPNYGFEKNMKIRGWNEALITYILAASSPTYPITKAVYDDGWAGGQHMINGKDYYGINLPLGPDYGGPLFFEQYTFLGIDPSQLQDSYANYHSQTVNHTLINRKYCIVNPYGYIGYSKDCWGLTASDGDQGYSAHSPTNDRGVITPTAAISSLPYTPEESMDVIRFLYYTLGDRVWGPYGFYDAFNVTADWWGNSNIAIDQGPILLMIENYRTGLLWSLFMSAPEVQDGLSKLEFTY